jgi:hypothetical protein
LAVAPSLSTIGNLRWMVGVSLGVFNGSIPIGGFVPFWGFRRPRLSKNLCFHRKDSPDI